MELEKIRENRLDGLERTIYYYDELCKGGHKLSAEQRAQLQKASNTACVFGDYGDFLHEIAEELLAS